MYIWEYPKRQVAFAYLWAPGHMLLEGSPAPSLGLGSHRPLCDCGEDSQVHSSASQKMAILTGDEALDWFPALSTWHRKP